MVMNNNETTTNPNRYNELTPGIQGEIDKLINHIAACAGTWSEQNVMAHLVGLRIKPWS